MADNTISDQLAIYSSHYIIAGVSIMILFTSIKPENWL